MSVVSKSKSKIHKRYKTATPGRKVAKCGTTAVTRQFPSSIRANENYIHCGATGPESEKGPRAEGHGARADGAHAPRRTGDLKDL